MKGTHAIFLLPFLCLSTVSASFAFLGFGSSTTERPTKISEDAVEAASANIATVVLPNTATNPGHTNILFGSGVATQTSTTELRGLGTQSITTVGGGMGLPTGGMGLPTGGRGLPTGGRLLPPGGRIRPITKAPSGPPPPQYLPVAARPPYHHNDHNTQTQTKGQGYQHSPPSLPQPYSPRMPLHNPHLPPPMAQNPSGMSHLHSGNTQPHLTNPNSNLQIHNGQSASHQIETSNGIRFTEETQTLDNYGGEKNEFGNTGKTTSKTGSFSWTSPEGQLYEVSYVADELGFRPTGTHIPTPTPQVKVGVSNEPQSMGGQYQATQPKEGTPYRGQALRTSSSSGTPPSGSTAYAYSDFKPTSHFPA